MKVSFHIGYQPKSSQKVCLLGSVAELGRWESVMAKKMECVAEGHWQLEVEIPSSVTDIDYQYLLVNEDGSVVYEPWNCKHHVNFDFPRSVYCLYDYWREKPTEISLYTSAFTKNLFAHADLEVKADFLDRCLVLKVFNPRVEKHRCLAIAGNQACLGNWDITQSRMLTASNFPEWEIRFNLNEISFPFEYKFFTCNTEKGEPQWETGDNRILTSPPIYEREIVVVSDYPYRETRHPWKGAGVVIPVFSLRSEHSFGVGDLGDLKLLIDWARQTNQCLIQVLPMNDTTRTHTWRDSYPYSAISIYALHPMYLSLEKMGELDDEVKMNYFREQKQLLNAKKIIDYELVEKYKGEYCRAFFEQEGKSILKSSEFKNFWKANQAWLIPYATFCYYRDKYHTADFTSWGEDAQYKPSKAEKLCSDSRGAAYSAISFSFFIQFQLHIQYKQVSDYAREMGVILKGDLPIGIHRNSVEAWTDGKYFNNNGQAGAPPDDFSTIGQNWSFPTYNWDVMEKDNFTWWRKRFQKMSDYFDCFRIDHILGFFRIWEIPLDYVQGLCGHFRPALPFTIEEIESYDIRFKRWFIQPSIHRQYLAELFGERANEVAGQYLSPIDADHLALNSFCDTQRKIQQLFYNKDDDASQKIKNGLFAIANEVLFLEDPYESQKYHPRISADKSYKYQELTGSEQGSFDELYQYFFYERHHDFWKSTALKRLKPLVENTEMLVCGEDLGMIPDSVHEVMEELNILSLELGRLSKIFGHEFSDLEKVPYYSVCTTSTHDMSPIRCWWKEDAVRTQNYYHSVLQMTGTVPAECTSEIAQAIIAHHLKAASMLTIIPLQDWLAMSDALKREDADSERINVPANPHHYWHYRMHITLEQLLQADEFNKKISAMIFENHRTEFSI